MRFHLEDFLGEHAEIVRIRKNLPQLAVSRLPILIHGETGTGKTMLASIIHELSDRGSGTYLHLDCGSMVEDLVANELFGHVRGSFTGADRTQAGLIEAASGGTLFLDELGNLSFEAQTKLLQVLDEGKFRRVGSVDEIAVDVRILGASTRPLQRYVEQGRLRKDLYYRLKGIRIDLPPLRERREDILPLFQHFLAHFSQTMHRRPLRLTRDGRELLLNYPWPGNVRELLRLAEELACLHGAEYITATDLAGYDLLSNCCWQVKHCERRECPAYHRGDHRCWLVAHTLGPDGCPHELHEKLHYCLHCEVFLGYCAQVDGGTAADRFEFLSRQVREWCHHPAPQVLADGGYRVDHMSFRQFREQVVAGSIRHYLGAVMRGCDGRVEEACRVSGLSRSSLYQLLREHGLKVDEFRQQPPPNPTA